jgi:hypothetical protein
MQCSRINWQEHIEWFRSDSIPLKIQYIILGEDV